MKAKEPFIDDKGNVYCPFVKSRLEDESFKEECYLVRLDSMSIKNVMQYCKNNYSDCDVYKKYSAQE